MILTPGDKILVSHRRLFEHDQPRTFLATVDAYEDGVVKATGYSWIREHVRGTLYRKDDMRTKIISLRSDGVMCYQLPAELDLDSLELVVGDRQRVVLTDGAEFSLDLTDRTSNLRMGTAVA